ncbi:glycoside hydrolase family 31 protein [Rhodanobacter glycinis]|uniref:Glycoside hydrolase family 31 protein n=1 Tax=Rhodanobacter glycinis TaxID=582702 RepID=A0A502C1I4_9GAMM|nr:TIM-barrel domain-containing protein [Rhodanobacter glycinis]TPG07335.1 glycoside hydrolase family 31 protein [Rhodanobacter glycinis]
MVQTSDHAQPTDLIAGQLTLRFVAPGILHVQRNDVGQADASTLVIDHDNTLTRVAPLRPVSTANDMTLTSGRGVVRWDRQHQQLLIDDLQKHGLLQLDLSSPRRGALTLQHDPHDALYGIGGYNATADASAGMLRSGRQIAAAGEQGHAGAPFVWSSAGYGVLLDGDGATFALAPGTISVSGTARQHPDFYVLLGTPAQIFSALARLSGRSPLFPKWAMGFTNSQWGIDQHELLQIVDTYRAKHIPIDNFTLDFDWKAWGEDDYGEFRWNAIKFPDAPSGKLKAELDQRGIHLTGIMKPRVHVDTVEGRYATAHDLWRPDEKAAPDYFSHKPVKDIDFDKPAARAWFFNDALKQSFATGMAGWWNDEADNTPSNTQFLNMQRTLYDGQRAISNQRVWSVNRNFWLGSQRYAYGLWSGDIPTGFASMAGQRARMLSAINVGAMQWGMDGGGFKNGTPTPENYARWIEFGAFTPIFRVHGDFGQKRQPWVYGPVAEKAATDAIRLRYALIPYIYSYAHRYSTSGIGLVRPLLFDWPDDPKVRNDVDAWLFGDWLLASPVVIEGQTGKNIYLPAGRWTDWFSGKVYDGGQDVHLAIDSKAWGDIPLFVRDGAIIPTQPVMDHVGEHPVTQLDVEVFPAGMRTQFDYYDDDGATYDYEHGAYFSQSLAVQRHGDTVQFETGAVTGSFKPALQFYLLKIHGSATGTVSGNGKAMPNFADLDALQRHHGDGWASGHDRFDAVTWVRIAAATRQIVVLSPER